MGRKRNKNQMKQEKAYAEAATKPPPEQKNISTVVPVVTAEEIASDSAVLYSEPVPTSGSPSISEDDAVDVAPPPTLDTESGNALDPSPTKPLGDSSGSDFSLLKKEEISEAGSPGQLAKKTSGKDASKEDPFTEINKCEDEKSGDRASASNTFKEETGLITGTDTKASLHSSGIDRELPNQGLKDTLIRAIPKPDWDKIFESTNEGKEGPAATS